MEIGYTTGTQGLDPTNPYVFFIHGSGGSAASWQGCLSPLGDQVNAVALDLPGHGQTIGPHPGSVAGLAEWVYQAMGEFNPDRFILAGHSLGGAIAQQFALNHPDDLAGLILIGSGARLKVAPQILEGIKADFPAAVSLIVDWCFHTNDETLKETSREMISVVGSDILHADLSACDRFDLMAKVGQIACPTLVVTGREDRMTPPKYAEFLAQKIPTAELCIIEGAGHMVQAEKPREFIEAVRAFTSRVLGQT